MDRVILHVDGNNFFASCECLLRPELADVPMAVAGDRESRHGIILAKTNWPKPAKYRRRNPSGRPSANVRGWCWWLRTVNSTPRSPIR